MDNPPEHGITLYVAVPRKEVNAVLREGYTASRSGVLAATTREKAMVCFQENYPGRAATPLQISKIPRSVRIVYKRGEFEILTDFLPAHHFSAIDPWGQEEAVVTRRAHSVSEADSDSDASGSAGSLRVTDAYDTDTSGLAGETLSDEDTSNEATTEHREQRARRRKESQRPPQRGGQSRRRCASEDSGELEREGNRTECARRRKKKRRIEERELFGTPSPGIDENSDSEGGVNGGSSQVDARSSGDESFWVGSPSPAIINIAEEVQAHRDRNVAARAQLERGRRRRKRTPSDGREQPQDADDPLGLLRMDGDSWTNSEALDGECDEPTSKAESDSERTDVVMPAPHASGAFDAAPRGPGARRSHRRANAHRSSQQGRDEALSKDLSTLLRYNAHKRGIHTDSQGFANISDVARQLNRPVQDILNVAENSFKRNQARFEVQSPTGNGQRDVTIIRATRKRKLQALPQAPAQSSNDIFGP